MVLEGNGSGSDCVDCWNGSDWDYWEDWGLSQSLFSDTELVVVTTLCIPLLLFGLMGNMLTILVVWRCPQMRSTTYLYLSSMAVSDILILLLMPLDLYKVCEAVNVCMCMGLPSEPAWAYVCICVCTVLRGWIYLPKQ